MHTIPNEIDIDKYRLQTVRQVQLRDFISSFFLYCCCCCSWRCCFNGCCCYHSECYFIERNGKFFSSENSFYVRYRSSHLCWLGSWFIWKFSRSFGGYFSGSIQNLIIPFRIHTQKKQIFFFLFLR